MRKRNRACEECQRLKIKCDVNAALGGACERCSRNHLECVPAAPRLQRDRINELEAHIQELKTALREQSNGSTPSRSPASHVEDQDQAVLSFLDARIPLNQQQALLHLFTQQPGAAWPVLRPSMDLGHIRTKSPILLLCLLVYPFTQQELGLESDVHEELVQRTMHIIGEEVIARGQRSLELVQALLVSAFWNKSTRKGQQASCFQIVQLAADMAIDLGIGGLSWMPSPAAYFCRHEDPASLDARRTWLACYVALATSSISMRRPNTVPWNDHHQDCLLFLEARGDASDQLFCQIVRITQLIQEIADQLCLFQISVFVDANHYSTHATIETLRSKVHAWASNIPPPLASSPTLKVYGHVAMIHLYEVALHTHTNKASFAAPFIPGRISVKDFPKPTNLIAPLETALGIIVQNCHAVIDTATEMDPALVLRLPTFCFAPVVIYSLFVLVTALVAATDPANTYGQCLAKDSFRIEECGLKLRLLTRNLRPLDPTMSCWTTRLFDATSWLEEWYADYSAILQRYQMTLDHNQEMSGFSMPG
jgi:hypothetical protein